MTYDCTEGASPPYVCNIFFSDHLVDNLVEVNMTTAYDIIRHKQYVNRRLNEDIRTSLASISRDLNVPKAHTQHILRVHLPTLYAERLHRMCQKEEDRIAVIIEALEYQEIPQHIAESMRVSKDYVIDIAYKSGNFTLNSGSRPQIDALYAAITKYAQTHDINDLPAGWSLKDSVVFMRRYVDEIMRWSEYYGRFQRTQTQST